ncbi:MAG: lipoyl(octanoyl) transferase LipB [Gammaproteobacteria bacterium]|nr:lipoyl(octanoyl) transferase LipB [Gammaproteobacteria bacterium]
MVAARVDSNAATVAAVVTVNGAAEQGATVNAAESRGVVVRRLGLRDYGPVWEAMRDFTARRAPGDADQIWLLQHAAVFTQGTGCRVLPRGGDGDGVAAAFDSGDGDGDRDGDGSNARNRALETSAADIPVIHSDRGGDITYHAPGQLIAYLLLDLKRRGLGVKSLVCRIEQAVIELLADYGLDAGRRAGAPGVYLRDGDGDNAAKIAALGLRIKRGCCYHGLSLNVDMDLRPYRRIDPCGYADLEVTQMRARLPTVDIGEVEDALLRRLLDQFD